MLQAIRSKANSYIVRVLFALLAATFALWGIGDIFRNWGSDTSVAKVASREITADQVNTELHTEMDQLRTVLGTTVDADQAKQMGLVNASLQRIIDGYLVDQEISDLGLVVGNEAVRQTILADPAFKDPTGNFDRNRYNQLLAANQLTEPQFEELTRQQLVRQQLTGALADGMSAPSVLTDTLYRSRAERRTADVVTLTPASVAPPPVANDDQIAAFYDAHKDQFQLPERRGFSVALLRIDDIAATIKIPDDQLKAEYDQRSNEFQTPEQRDVQQILLSDETKAKAAKAQLDAGQDFAAVAKSASGADAASTDLGWVKKDDLPPELAAPAFALAQGKASDPIHTSFGWHILRVTGMKPATTQSFEAVKPQLAQEMARDQAADAIAKTANDIDDAFAAGNSFASVVQKFALKTTSFTDVDASGKTPDGKALSFPENGDTILRTAFSSQDGETSPLGELGDDGYFIVHVDKITAAAAQPLSDARAHVISAWQADQRENALAKAADVIVQQIKGGKSLKQIAAAQKLPVTSTGPIARTQEAPTVPPSLVAALFGVKQGDSVSVPAGSGYVVAQLQSVEPADPAKDAAAVKQLSDELSNGMRNDVLGAFDQGLRARYPVEVNQANLDHVL